MSLVAAAAAVGFAPAAGSVAGLPSVSPPAAPATACPTDDALGTGKWGLGPTFVVLKQAGPWTVGYLGSHIWSIAGDDKRNDVDVWARKSYSIKTGPRR